MMVENKIKWTTVDDGKNTNDYSTEEDSDELVTLQ